MRIRTFPLSSQRLCQLLCPRNPGGPLCIASSYSRPTQRKFCHRVLNASVTRSNLSSFGKEILRKVKIGHVGCKSHFIETTLMQDADIMPRGLDSLVIDRSS